MTRVVFKILFLILIIIEKKKIIWRFLNRNQLKYFQLHNILTHQNYLKISLECRWTRMGVFYEERKLLFYKQTREYWLMKIWRYFSIFLHIGDPLPGGNRWTCTNEGEEVAPKTNIANINCFRCICQVSKMKSLQQFHFGIIFVSH